MSKLSRKVNVLMPEPITLMDDERSIQESMSGEAEDASDQNFTFLKAHVTDCTVVNGENGSKFAVWKVSLVLQSFDHNGAYRPCIDVYKRYSEFHKFRESLVRKCKEADLHTVDIPRLPPRVKWYETWRYQDVNLNKVWLAKRRRGLDYFMNKVLLNSTLVSTARDLIVKFLEETAITKSN